MFSSAGFETASRHDGHRFSRAGDGRAGLDGMFSDQVLRRGLMLRGAASAFGGAVLGIIVSMIVNVSLVEVSTSPFFRMYFGLLFLVVSALMMIRVVSGQSPDPDERHQKHLLFFSALVGVSGILCLILHHNWFIHLPRLAKVPIYTVLGTAVAFSLTFTIVDLINVLVGAFQSTAAKPLVQSIGQIRLVISISLLMGAIFGTIFGLMGVEEEVSYHVRLALMREEHYCIPVGGILGALTGFANEFLRLKDPSYQSLAQSEFNEDI